MGSWSLVVCIKAEMMQNVLYIKYKIITSQWLKINCGLANPLVLLRISSANPKLSATGRTALMMNMSVPSFISSWRTRPSRFPSTPYTRPVTGGDQGSGHTQCTQQNTWSDSLEDFFQEIIFLKENKSENKPAPSDYIFLKLWPTYRLNRINLNFKEWRFMWNLLTSVLNILN